MADTSLISLDSPNLPEEYRALLAQADTVDTLADSFGTTRRLSIRGGVFREIVNGKEVSQFDGRALNIVILTAGPKTRTFYADKYREGENQAPACWSDDTNSGVPSPSVPEETRQCDRCVDCPMNIKGSGEGDSRACRYSQRIAVLLEEDLTQPEPGVYQFSVPATSLFGEGSANSMGLQAYARYLTAHKTPCVAVVTEARLDTASSTPKLTFKAVRPLNIDELQKAIALQKSPEALQAVANQVYTQDTGALPGPKAEATAAPAARRKPAEEPEPEPAPTTRRKPAAAAEAKPATSRRKPAAEPASEDDVGEPQVRTSRRAPAAAAAGTSTSVDDLLDKWDDDE